MEQPYHKTVDMFQRHLKWQFAPTAEADTNGLPEPAALMGVMLDCLQDGVMLLDTALRIRYANRAMRQWFNHSASLDGQLCHVALQQSESPCTLCAARQAMESGTPSACVKQYRSDNAPSWQLCYAIPLRTSQAVSGVILHIRDISFRMREESRLLQLLEEFQSLQRENEMLTHSLARQHRERQELEENIVHNLTHYVRPSLDYIKRHVNSTEIELLQYVIDDLIQPFHQHMDAGLDMLTSREMHIALLVRDGMTSKEIAQQLDISTKTVDFHRANLRRKLSAGREEQDGHFNLRTYLQIHLQSPTKG